MPNIMAAQTNIGVVDTVVGRAIVMVILWSVAAFKRVLAQGFLTINPVFVIIGTTEFVVVYIYPLFEGTCKHLAENLCYLYRYSKVFNCN